jgi:CubicO group peptidase (beta-lactamase class C family)
MKTSLKFLAAVVLVSNFSFGQDITKKIDSILKDSYQKNPNVSISVGFVNNNEEYYTAYGNLSKDSPTKVDKNTVFEIASITKILTSN